MTSDASCSSITWTVRNISQRLDTGNKPWARYAKGARSLSPAMKNLGYAPPRER